MTLRYCTLRIVIAVIVENKNTEIPLYIGLSQQLFSSKQQVYTPARLVRITPFGKIKTFFLPLLPAFLYNQSNQPINRAYPTDFLVPPFLRLKRACFSVQKALFYTAKQALLKYSTI